MCWFFNCSRCSTLNAIGATCFFYCGTNPKISFWESQWWWWREGRTAFWTLKFTAQKYFEARHFHIWGGSHFNVIQNIVIRHWAAFGNENGFILANGDFHSAADSVSHSVWYSEWPPYSRMGKEQPQSERMHTVFRELNVCAWRIRNTLDTWKSF